jgi:hypothetical protein
MATKEELIAQGYDEETAALLAKTSGTQSSGGMPFPVLKFNYDQKDLLIDAGIKKGEFISGWKIDNRKLEIVEEGEVLKSPMKFFIVSSVYQVNHYDTQTRTTDVQTDIFFSPYDTPKMVDKKSGLTVKQLKEKKMRLTFNNILLLMVETDDGYKPYLHYMHGTNYHEWNKQLEDLGISPDNIVLKTNFTVKPKKVPTDYQPAWVMEIVEANERSPKEIQESIPKVSEAIKKFNAWVDSVNAGESVESKNKAVGGTAEASGSPEIDVDEDEMPF